MYEAIAISINSPEMKIIVGIFIVVIGFAIFACFMKWR